MTESDSGWLELLGLDEGQESMAPRRGEVVGAVLQAIAAEVGQERQADEWCRYLVLGGGLVLRDGLVLVELTVWLQNRDLLLTSNVKLWTTEVLGMMRDPSFTLTEIADMPLDDIDTFIMEISDTTSNEEAVLVPGFRAVKHFP